MVDRNAFRQQLIRQRIRQKNYYKLEKCLAEYEESVSVKSYILDVLPNWLSIDVVHNILLRYIDIVHVKILGYISKNIGAMPWFDIVTPYEEVTYSPQQHKLLKQWTNEL